MSLTPRPPSHAPDPVLVEITRGPIVESLHRGAVVVADADGVIVQAWGDPDQSIYPRSAIKPLQALPLIETGAAERFGLGLEEIALACASHGGEAVHVERVAAWLDRLGLGIEALECGAHWPSNIEAARALARAGGQPLAVHNNCSGKHAGFLTTALHLGEPLAGYIQRDHPVQRRVAETLSAITGVEAQHQPCGIDGCGIPTFALPLQAVATAMARLAAPDSLPPPRAEAARKIVAAMQTHPELVAGSSRLCSMLMRTVPGVVAKGGAEGFYAAALSGRGLGIALKITDGAARAAEVALMAVLNRLDVFDSGQSRILAERIEPIVLNVAGHAVGMMRAAPEWLDQDGR